MNFTGNWLTLFREKIIDPLEDVQEKLKALWLGLAPRERLIVTILGGVMSVLILAVVLKESNDIFFKGSFEAEKNQLNADKIQKIATQTLQQREALDKYQRLKEKRGADFKLNSFLEKEASQVGITIAKITPTRPRLAPGEKEDKNSKANSNEEWVEVQLGKDLSFDATVRYLNAIQEALGVRLVELSMKPQFADPTKFEVTAVVANKKEL